MLKRTMVQATLGREFYSTITPGEYHNVAVVDTLQAKFVVVLGE